MKKIEGNFYWDLKLKFSSFVWKIFNIFFSNLVWWIWLESLWKSREISGKIGENEKEFIFYEENHEKRKVRKNPSKLDILVGKLRKTWKGP